MRHTILMFKAVLILCMVNTTLLAQTIQGTQDSIRAVKKFQIGIVGESQTGSVDLNHAPINRKTRADGYTSKSLGLVLEYNVSHALGFGVQPKFSTNKYTLRYITEEQYEQEEVKTNYLQLPLYVTYTYEFENSSPFLSFGVAPNFKISNNESENVYASDIFFDGFVKIGVDIKKGGLAISPFLALNNSLTDIYQFSSDHGIPQTATKLGMAFGLSIIY